MLFDILRKFKLIAKVFALLNNLVPKKISQFDNIIYVVTVFYIVWLVNHPYVIEYIIFASNELE